MVDVMSDATHNHDLLTTLNAQARELRKHIPDVYQGFAATHKAAMAEGALSTKVKELIALAIGVTNRCDGCIASHARGAARAGATKEEAAEAMGVAILLNGGHSTVYGPRAYAAFCEFADGQN
ncbi:alkyl hydroperoxide reductase AhpD [Mycolicibacterium insubricum]|jgi:AhpD family alkylhydroperoxidase|nr:alkyl hydroperoxide reductase AhpD [Mycolicibacterium insubricum]